MNNIVNYIQSLTLSDFIRILTAILIALLFHIFSGLLTRLFIHIFHKKEGKNKKEKISDNYLFQPLTWYLKLLGVYLGLLYVKPNQEVLLIINKIVRMITILFACKALSSYITHSNGILKKISSKLHSDSKASILISKVLVFVIYFIGIALILSEIGYDISTLVAGLGISGVIVALAAQDTAKNLFGGAIILLDKPFVIGDWIQTSSMEGIVEDITFRSTRIRTFKDSLVTIPNSILTNESITNWSQMNKRKTTIELELLYATTLKKVYNFTASITKMLLEEENILNDSVTVNFTNISANGYNITISYCTPITNYRDYLAVKEEINYKIMQILESKKISLAYPSYDLYIKNEK